MKQKTPTKQEIKAARVKRRKGFALIREAQKVLFASRRTKRRRAFVRRSPDDAVETFYTWQHDFSVLLPAVVRAAGSEQLTPDQIIDRVVQAADLMKKEVAARRPEGSEGLRRREILRGPMTDWHRWQMTFDGLVHDMCSNSTMAADHIIGRAVVLSDLSIAETERRRPGKRRKAER